MYSRAQRKFLNPEKDQANPLLGPGCYTREEAVLVTGKLFGKSGFDSQKYHILIPSGMLPFPPLLPEFRFLISKSAEARRLEITNLA